MKEKKTKNHLQQHITIIVFMSYQKEQNKQSWTGRTVSHANINTFFIIKQFLANCSISLCTIVFFYKLPHQASRNLFNIRKCLIEETQFHPENCTHPGEQVISYLINYWGLVSLPNCCHLIQYWNWKFKGECIRECFMDDEKSAKVKVLLHSEKKFLIFCLYFI